MQVRDFNEIAAQVQTDLRDLKDGLNLFANQIVDSICDRLFRGDLRNQLRHKYIKCEDLMLLAINDMDTPPPSGAHVIVAIADINDPNKVDCTIEAWYNATDSSYRVWDSEMKVKLPNPIAWWFYPDTYGVN